MAKMYVTEIVRLDPYGPYLLGGWSVGGILAFEAARLLRELNRVVQGLFLIDAPCPGTIPPLSQDTIQLLDRLGVITSKELQPQPRPQLQQQWRRPGREESIRAHFMGTIQALKTYNPLSTREDDAYDAPPPPKCLTLWASDGVWETIEKAKGAAAAASMRNYD
ncbi:alpha/beta-hydrolase [Aspergillus fijiensis CBS 313.89]|uniref:Alpha/beta-hydrolase n=1 Tax=Aspergillus fijiensis CBS 313.89 TaxID=1448319 RepID=A0A8G1RGE3_9EURO|nr:alpha/beta-hydrolase [Aspergillus fijiensis CBS 313.89]RAK71663.1 alpha/beta-hydrolase [Aspergillus fijiensis CBS 313.89]